VHLDAPRRLHSTGGIEVTKTSYAFALLAALVALVIAGCGGGGDSTTSEGGSAANTQPASGSSEGESTLTGAEVSGLGMVLVDSEGFTVYEFAKDNGTTSSCYGTCEEDWPPVTTNGAPAAGEGAMSSQLGTTKRKDGTLQVTYAGHPLYTFFEDESPGEASGNGLDFFGGKWSVLDESGSTVEASSGEETEAVEESSSGGGYGY
jgi:predicted lipoprotein with Yx(FWY)xxD motif